jgi:penicillin-binding protein 2
MRSKSRRALLGSLLTVLPGGSLLAAAPKAARARRRQAYTLPQIVLPSEASFRDRQIAEACQHALGRARGAVVAMDPWTGRVVAVVNPQEALLRAYQPCSVFKIVVGIAGLSEGLITPESTYVCSRGCWMWPGHGPIDLRRALAVSCNPYFEWVGERLGYAKVQEYAHLLGLGERSGINLAGETPGVVPARVRPEAVGHLSSHAEGIATSALQLGVLLSACINGGIVFQPRVGAAAGFEAQERWRLPPSTRTSGLQDGFVGAVNEGSASAAFDPDVVVAGKTGTCSQLGWFASYAPAPHAEVVVVVFLRYGSGHGASAVAGQIYQELFKPKAPVVAAGAAGSSQ